jgi:hypothetical protein
VDETPKNNTTMVDVLTLEGFKATLDARLDEAESVKTNLVELLRRTEPELGDLADARYVCRRYKSLYDQHLNRVVTLIDAINATKEALTTIISNYTTNEARQTANALDIADALGAITGTQDGEHRHA